MRSLRRALTAVVWVGTAVALAGCGSFDPLDWFSTKKPLPGERHLVFPEGVPGVPQGVPQDLVKGNQPPTTDTASTIGEGAGPTGEAASATATAAAKPVKPAPKTRVASRPKPRKPKEATAPVQPTSEPASRITIAPTKPATEANGKSGTLPSAQSPADNAIWGATPGHTAASGANAPWPAEKPQPMSNAPWPDAPNPNQFSR